MLIDIKLSVCLVVKNEEKYLPQCLSSIKNVADEIILVDTGSSDNTLEIAKQFTDKIFEIRWRDDFSEARNFALDKANGEWILILDGDEELDSKCVCVLQETISKSKFEGYLVKVVNYYDAGERVEVAPDVVFRLFKNNKKYRYTGVIHEQICDNIISANSKAQIGIAEEICIIHYGYLKEVIKAQNKAERNTRLLQKAVENNPDNLLNRFHLGVEYFRNNKIGKALQEFLFVFDKVSMLAVYAPKLMRYITQCYYLKGDLSGALNFIEDHWKKHYQDQGDLYYLKGIVCRELGRYAEAYEAFRNCLTVPPQPARYASLYCQYQDKVYYRLGEIAEYFWDKERALEYYIKAQRENPNSINPLAKVIGILKPRENPEYTINSLEKVFDLSEPALQLNLGNIFFREGAYRLAVQCFDRAAAHLTLPLEARLVKGLSLLRLRKFKTAVEELKSIPFGNQFYVTAQGNLFIYHWLKKHNRRTAACLGNIKKVGSNPALTEVLEILTKGWHASSDDLNNDVNTIKSVVTETVERLIELKEFEAFEDAWKCFEGLWEDYPAKMLGDLYYKHGCYEKAETEYRSLLGKDADEPQVFYKLGKTCWLRNNLFEAEKFIYQAIERGYSLPEVRWQMARLYQELAIKTLEEGLAKYPGNKELLYLLQQIKSSLIED